MNTFVIAFLILPIGKHFYVYVPSRGHQRGRIIRRYFSRGSINADNGPFSALARKTRGASIIAIDPSAGEKSGRGCALRGRTRFSIDLKKRRKSRLMYRAAVAD